MSEVQMINCPACGRNISSAANACPVCGQPVTDEIRAEGIKQMEEAAQEAAREAARQIEKKRNKRYGCLGTIAFIILYAIISSFFHETKTFQFDEREFMAKFLQRIERNKYNVKCTVLKKDEDGSEYKLSDNIKLNVLTVSKTGKVWKVYIRYDNVSDYNYNTKHVVESVECVGWTLFDFSLLNFSDPRIVTDYVRVVMSFPANKRSSQATKETSNEKIEIEVRPAAKSISFQAK
jgi:hypothetical protein